MKLKTRVKAVIAGSLVTATLFVPSAGGQTPQKTVIKNNTVSGYAPLNTGPFVGIVSARIGLGNENKPVAFITVDVCSPDGQPRYCLYADGVAPASAISATGTESVTVDVANISALSGLNGNVVDCTTGVCMGLPIPPIAFRGTWTRYQGSNSFDTESAGIEKRVGRFLDRTITEVRIGMNQYYSAAFRGNLGTTQLEIAGMGGPANISFSKNTMIEITRTASR